MKKCQFCSAELPDEAKFCSECGKKLSVVCSCGQPLTGNEKFCPSCGSPTMGGTSKSNAGSGSTPVGFAEYSEGGFNNYGIPDVKQNKPQIVIEEGEVLNQYVVKRKLGQGGFGSVYEVFDNLQEKSKAIKVITLENDSMLNSLKTEFESREKITDLKHIIRGYDFSMLNYKSEKIVIYPMELADKSFRDWLNEANRNKENYLDESLNLFYQTCLGVKALHEAGLIHLDLKPENILLEKDNLSNENKFTVKITDFGLSRGTGKMPGSFDTYSDGIGSPKYMAPEQIRAAHWKDVTKSADIYALGMILFEILDGDLPYSGTPAQLKEKKLDRNLRIRRPEMDNALADLALQSIAYDIEKRPKNINVLLESLKSFNNNKSEISDGSKDNVEDENAAKKIQVPPVTNENLTAQSSSLQPKNDLAQALKRLNKLIEQEDEQLLLQFKAIDKKLSEIA